MLAQADLARNPGSALHLAPGDFLLPALATGLQVGGAWPAVSVHPAAALWPLLLLHASSPAAVPWLQVPRALEVGNHMWFTGTSWSTAFAALQAAAVAAARGSHGAAACALLLLALSYALLLKVLAQAQGLPSPRSSLAPILEAYRAQLRPFGELRASVISLVRRAKDRLL